MHWFFSFGISAISAKKYSEASFVICPLQKTRKRAIIVVDGVAIAIAIVTE